MDKDAHGAVDPDFGTNCVFRGQDTHGMFGDVVLVSPRNDPDRFLLKGGRQGARRTRQSLGLMFLASHLQERLGYRFSQAEMADDEQMVAMSSGAVVGLSVLPSNYLSGVALAEKVKEVGARMVVVGGPYATCRAQQMLRCRAAVDCVVSGPGELALEGLLLGLPHEDICGITSRVMQPDRVYVSRRKVFPLGERVVTDYGLWPWSDERIAITYHQDGCPVAVSKTGPCHFCCATRTAPNRRTVDQACQELQQLAEFEIWNLEDGGDDFAYGGNEGVAWMRELAKRERAEGWNFERFVHVSVKNATYPGMMQALAGVGVRVMQVGFEAGDPAMMISAKTAPDKVEELITLAAENGIRFFASIVIGHPGETETSAMRSVELIFRLYGLGLLFGIESEISCPFPGTRDFSELCEFYSEWREMDYISSEVLMSEWIVRRTNLTWEQALTIRNLPIEILGDKVECTGSMNY